MASLPKRYFLLSLGIAIILAFFVGYGIEVVDPSPKYDDFCSSRVYEARNETACLDLNATWHPNQPYPSYPPSPEPDIRPTPEPPVAQYGSCSQPYSCEQNYRGATLAHDRIVFIVTLIMSLLAFIIGTMLSRELTSTGLYAGAIFTLLYGTGRYWPHADNILKFVLLGIALSILIWITLKKLHDKKQ